MRFSWDEEKRRTNRRKHGIDFEEAKAAFDDPLAVSIVDKDHSVGEERWSTIGMSSQGRLLVIAHTYLQIRDKETIRIINARRATAPERKKYEEER